MSKLEVTHDHESERNCSKNAKRRSSKELEVFLQRIEKTSVLSKDWLRALAYCQIVDLKFCRELRRTYEDDKKKKMSSIELMDLAVNLWYKLPLRIRQKYREPSLIEPNTLQIKFQQHICDIYLNESNKRLNLYTWFVAEYFSNNENNALEDNMIKATEKFHSLEPIEIEKNHLNKFKENSIKSNSITDMHNITASYACFIYGPSYTNFYIEYAKLRPELQKAEATQHAVCFWNLFPKKMKARFSNETDMTASPNFYSLDDNLKWCDGGLHIGIKSVGYCAEEFRKINTHIITTDNKILPTDENNEFTYKQFFAIKEACIKWLKNCKQ